MVERPIDSLLGELVSSELMSLSKGNTSQESLDDGGNDSNIDRCTLTTAVDINHSPPTR